MPYREESYIEGVNPKAYPPVDQSRAIHVVTVGLDIAQDPPVGYLIWQGRALEWYTNVGPKDGWRYGVRAQVEGIIADALDRNLDAAECWDAIMTTAPIALVAHEDNPERFYETLRKQWAAGDE